QAYVGVSLWTIGIVMLTMVGFFGLVVRVVARTHKLKPVTGREGMLSRRGTARTALEPDGKVFVDGALWEATSESGPMPKGASGEVVGIDGLHLRVRQADAEPAPHFRGRWSRPIQGSR